jgi:hypothetical protein
MATHVAASPAAAAGIEAQIELARQAAMEVFGNCAGIELIDNPEVDGESWYEFNVVDRVENEDYKAVVQRRLRWHERVHELIPVTDPDEFPDFRLSIEFEP